MRKDRAQWQEKEDDNAPYKTSIPPSLVPQAPSGSKQ